MGPQPRGYSRRHGWVAGEAKERGCEAGRVREMESGDEDERAVLHDNRRELGGRTSCCRSSRSGAGQLACQLIPRCELRRARAGPSEQEGRRGRARLGGRASGRGCAISAYHSRRAAAWTASHCYRALTDWPCPTPAPRGALLPSLAHPLLLPLRHIRYTRALARGTVLSSQQAQ